MTQPTFGTGSGGFAQPDLWQLLYGMTNINPALQMALQQYRSQSTLSGQLAQANASAQTGANAAMANVYGSQVAAQGGIAQQGIQSGTAASIANAQISADLIAAMGGDQNAAHRLQATLGLEAGIANQGMQQKILSALSTTGLRSQSQANAWMRGFQPQPGFGSAGNYWLNSVNPISAPQVQYSPYDLSGLMQASAPSANFTMPSMPTFNTGGFGGGSVGNIGGMFTDIYGQLQNTLGPMELLFGNPASAGGTGGLAPNGFPAGSPEAIAATQSMWEQLLAGQGSGSTWGGPAAGNFGPNSPQMLHAGGKIRPGQTAIVGERGPELLKSTEEGSEVIPFGKFRGGFHTGTGPHSHAGKPTPDPGDMGDPFDPGPPLQPGDPGYFTPMPGVGGPIPGGIPKSVSPDPMMVTGATPLNPPNGPVPGGYWQNGKFYPDPVKAGGATTYPTVDYNAPGMSQWDQGPLKAASSPREYILTPEETAQIEVQARAELDAMIAAAPSWQRERMRGNYQGTLLGIINRLTQELVANPPPPTTPDIGIPPGEEPVVEPPVEGELEQPPNDPRTGEPSPDLSTLLSNFYEGFSYDPSQDLSGTGAEALGLPGIQALLGNAPQGFPGNQTFDLPELGMSGIRGPAQSASIFRPGILTPQEIDDISYLFQLGGYDPSTAAHIIQQFTPGRGSPFASLGF